jgi:hypothetical protein
VTIGSVIRSLAAPRPVDRQPSWCQVSTTTVCRMRVTTCILTGGFLAVALATTEVGFCQPQPFRPTLLYTLEKGSQLVDDCPVCDRIPTVAPMTGAFQLQWLGTDPVFARYAWTNISFHAQSPSGFHYEVSGGGNYRIGGEVAVVQDLFLSLQIDDGLTNQLCLLTNPVQAVTNTWPEIQVSVDQTNGTAFRVYHLQVLAVPALQFVSVVSDSRTGSVGLEWQGDTGAVQLERATNAAGPFSPIGTNLTAQSFEDAGALTNHQAVYYRLVQP